MDKVRVVFHVSESQLWPRALKNIYNFLRDVGDQNAVVEVVANALGVNGYFTDDEVKKKMMTLAERGVLFTACRNALRDQGLSEENLPPFVQVVPAGISELVKKQKEGYAYIKP